MAIDATYAVDPQPSGVAVYSQRLIESLAELQSQHRFLVCYRLSRWRQRGQFLRFKAAGEGKPPAFTTCLFQEPWTFWLPRKAGIFHSLAQRPAPFHFRKEIVTIHDAFPLTSRDYSTANFQLKFARLLIGAARRAARIITPSHYTADELVDHAGIERVKICVIPEGVDVPEDAPDADRRRKERARRVGEGNELVLVVGVIQTRKNTLGALRALERLPARYRMILAGGNGHGSEAVHDYLQKAAGLRERVTVLGHVGRNDLDALYEAASVLLFPSFAEGFGLPVLEAMAYGLPVVTSNLSAMPEVGGDAALYVDPHDESEIAAKVIQAAENKGIRNRMIQTGLARARLFSWRRAARATLRVYDEALAGCKE